MKVFSRARGDSPNRAARVEALAGEMRREGVPMLLVPDTEAAAVHAAEHGWIDPGRLPGVREEKVKDEIAPSPTEAALEIGPA